MLNTSQDNAEARQELKFHTKPPEVESRLLVKRDNRPETVNMKISNEDGVSVTVATRAAAIRTSQGRCTPRRDRDSKVKA